jgi:Domain of unknown function (DUF4198)
MQILRVPSTIASLLAGLLCWAAASGPASAHDFWIEPSSHAPVPGQPVSTRLLVGEHFRGDPVPRPAPQGLHRFVLADTRGRFAATLPGRTGAEPAGQFRATTPGRWIVAYHGKPIAIELPAEVFNRYLHEEGLQAVLQDRAARGQADAPGREIYSRSAKTLLQAGSGAEVDAAPIDRALGFTIELVAQARPLGGVLPVRLLLDGQPLQGALVMALHHDAPQPRLEQRSDADGRVVLKLDRPGSWLVKAVHMRAAPDGSGADWESLWASLTLSVADDE